MLYPLIYYWMDLKSVILVVILIVICDVQHCMNQMYTFTKYMKNVKIKKIPHSVRSSTVSDLI